MLIAFPLCSSQLDCQPLRCSLPFHCVAVNWSVSLYKAVELQQAIIGLVAVGNKHLWRAQKRDVALQSHVESRNVEYVGHSVCVCHSQCRLMRAVNSFHVNHIHCAKSCSSSMHTCDVGQATKKTITRHTSHEVTLWPWQKRHTQTHAHMHKYTSSYTHVSIHTQHTCTRTHSHTHHQHALARLARMVYLLPQCSCLESSCSSPPTAHTWAWVMACVNCGCVFHKG